MFVVPGMGHHRSVNNGYFHSTNTLPVIPKGLQKELLHLRSLLLTIDGQFVLTETRSVLELQRRARSPRWEGLEPGACSKHS